MDETATRTRGDRWARGAGVTLVTLNLHGIAYEKYEVKDVHLKPFKDKYLT